MNLQLESIYRQRTTQKLQILTVDEHPEKYQGQQMRGRRGVRMCGGTEAKQRKKQKRPRTGAHIKYGPLLWTMLSIMAYNGWRVQLNIGRSTISSIIPTFRKKSLSINIPHTVMCKCVLLKWIYGIPKKRCCLNFSTVTVIQTVSINYSLHQVILTVCSVILTTWLSILTVLFVNNDTRTFHSDGTDMFIDINTYFWEMN